jgi:filamentous hemagglutinin
VIVSAKGAVNLYNNASYGAAQVSSTASGGQVSISAGQNINLNTGTSIAASADVQLSTDTMLVASAASVTSSGGNVTALAGKGISLTSTTVTGQQVHLETGAAFKDSAGSITITGGNVRGQNQTTLLATDSILVQSPNSPAVSGAGNVHIQAAKAVDIAAGSSVTAVQHMSVIAGTALSLQATSGSSATNGKKATLSAGGNLLVSGGTVTATGSALSAGQDLEIEANDGNANLNALYNAGGSSVDKLQLSAGKDLNVSVFKGALFATGLQASGQNIALLSNGTASVANASIKNGSNTQAVASTLTAREDLTVGSISTTAGTSSQVQVVASNLSAGGQARVFSNGLALITSVTDSVNGASSPVRSNITAGSVAIQGSTVQTDAADIRTNGDKSSAVKSGAITVTATTGNATFNTYGGYRSQFNSTGNIALHANGNLTHWYTQANAGGSLSSTSATGQIYGTGANLVAKDVLSLASKDTQGHASAYYSGGAVSIFNATGSLNLSDTRVQAVGTTTASLASLSGQISIESGRTPGLYGSSVLVSTTDLSIVQEQGDININPTTAYPGTLVWSQIGVGRNLTLATRNGNVNFTGSAGSNGVGSSSNVGLYVKGDFNLIGNNVNLQGSRLQTGGALNITATAGNLNANALQVNQTAAGYTNTYWDYAQFVGAAGVNLRAAGDINLNSIYVKSNGAVNILSGGNTAVAGNYAHYTVNDQPSGGWFRDERYLWRSVINGNTGVNIGALGGTLTLNATDISAPYGKVSLQALGAVNLQAAQEYRLHEMSQSGSDRNCFLFFCSTTRWTNYYHNEYLLNKPVIITAQDIEIKAGNTINTFGTQLKAGRNITAQAGDGINYYAVYDQKNETAKRNEKTGWGIGGAFSIRVGSSTDTNSLFQLSGQPTQLQSQWDILSQSGGNQLLQGTKVSYGGTASFQAGVGEWARADARIILEGLRNITTRTRTKEGSYVVWQNMANAGIKSETLVLPSISGPTKPIFSAPGGLTVQLPQSSDFKSQISTLAQQPGMGYLNTLLQRRDVNWQPVKLAYDQWDYKQSGLTPGGAALVAVVVAYCTAGVGSALVGAEAGTAGAAMANAAVSSLAAQATISLINNKGDIGKTLKELGSSQTVKATLAAVLTAGVLDKIGATDAMKSLTGPNASFADKLSYNLINATGRALTNTAITGGNLEDALKQALVGGIVDTAHGQVASKIGQANFDYVAHKLAHALAGCVAGAAAGGACKDGAIGSAVGEIVAEMFKSKVPAWNAPQAEWDAFDAQAKVYGKLVSGAVAAYAGGNAQTAITAAETAIDNNARIAFRLQAAQQSMTPMQFWTYMRVQSLQRAITESGGSVPSNMTTPGARINYTQSDVSVLETQLKGLSPQHQLIYSQPSSTVSPLPSSYVNMRYSVNMQNVGTGSSVNAFGFNRDSSAFFRELLRTNPELFSARNIER